MWSLCSSRPSFYFPQPIPSSHEFFLTELDSNDGYIHMSTVQQVSGVLNRFFADVDSVAILKIDYGRLSAFKRVRWEQTSSGECKSHSHVHLRQY